VDERVIKTIAGLVRADSPEARIGAASLLERLGRVDEETIDVLVSLLDSAERQRNIAMALLVQLKRTDERVVPRVSSSLHSLEPPEALARARVLVEMDCQDEAQ